jgi:hypothetical protein
VLARFQQALAQLGAAEGWPAWDPARHWRPS